MTNDGVIIGVLLVLFVLFVVNGKGNADTLYFWLDFVVRPKSQCEWIISVVLVCAGCFFGVLFYRQLAGQTTAFMQGSRPTVTHARGSMGRQVQRSTS
jgi:hypothetical protein